MSKARLETRSAYTAIRLVEGHGGKRFTFDYAFWSHGYKEEPSGFLVKNSETSRYADQNFVFDALGSEILNSAWTATTSAFSRMGKRE